MKFFQVVIAEHLCVVNLSIGNYSGMGWGGGTLYVRDHGNRIPDDIILS